MTKEMEKTATVAPLTTNIKDLIYFVRGQQVMLDSDLAMLYQVETKVFNQAVSRNIVLSGELNEAPSVTLHGAVSTYPQVHSAV